MIPADDRVPIAGIEAGWCENPFSHPDQRNLGVPPSAYGAEAGGDLNSDGRTDQADPGILLVDWEGERPWAAEPV